MHAYNVAYMQNVIIIFFEILQEILSVFIQHMIDYFGKKIRQKSKHLVSIAADNPTVHKWLTMPV